MNILFITNLKSLYGANHSLLNLIEGLKNHTVTPYVIAPDHGSFIENIRQRSIEYSLLPVPSWVSDHPFSLYQQKRSIQKMLNISNQYQEKIIDWKIDIVYTNSSVTPIGSVVALKTGLQHVWHIREFLDLHYGLQFIIPKWLALEFIIRSSSVICVSNAIRNHYFHKKATNIHVVQNGVLTKNEFEEILSKKQKNNSEKDYTFVMVGHIHPNKGQLKAIKALLRVTQAGYNARLHIAGDGSKDYLKTCIDYIEKMGLTKNVEFLGYVDNPFGVYQKADCYLMCSDYEAMGRVTAEAMACSLPVIGKNNGGTPEVIIDGTSGFLYDTDEELVKHMIYLIENPLIGKEMGEKGREIAKEKFSTENYAGKIYEIIKSPKSFPHRLFT